MNCVYATLMGKKLDLNALNEEQKELLRKLYKLYQENCDCLSFLNQLNFNSALKAMGAPFSDGQYLGIYPQVISSVIYQVLGDLCDKLTIKQGYLKMSKASNTDFAENEKVLKEFLS